MSIRTGNLGQELIVLCREVNIETGAITVYIIDKPVTEDLLFKLWLRSRVNPDLRYFCVLKSRWEEDCAEYEDLLRSGYVYHRSMEALGGIAEL